MTTVKPYLTFRGECQQALDFYQNCFGKGIHLMAYDASPDTPVQQGNTVQLGVDLDSKEEVTDLFNKLSAEGQSLADPQETSWNAFYARVRDKYGVNWMLNADLN